MTDAKDFTRGSLLGSNGVYEEFYKGDFKGHVFRGNQHSVGGIGHFDPYNAVFQTICASGHQNTVQVPPSWIMRDGAGNFTGQFASGANTQHCTTCQRPLANRWRLVNGQKFLPTPTPPATFQEWLYGVPKQNYVD
jgi:hypothetical protein